MSNNYSENDSPVTALKNESSRQRWEMFHRAIAHAKQSNSDALQEAEKPPADCKRTAPLLSIAR